MTKRFLSLLGAAVLLTIGTIGTYGQTTSSNILGTLVDPADALVPNSSITLTEQATGAIRKAVSNEGGLFRVLDLPPGRYTVRVQAAGFKALEVAGIELSSSETRDLGKLVLQIGTQVEEVSVTAAATPVQTASSERSALVDDTQLTDVTLKGRDPFGYMRLLPGVVDMSPDRSLGGSASNISINGMASNSKNVTFDGITELDQGGANAVYVAPNIDAITEMRVLGSGYQAEFGRTSGGAINMVTKAGTRDFHGTALWNRRHEDMNANDFFSNRSGIQRPLYRYFIGTYTIGGPVYVPRTRINKDKRRFFFFVSQEFTRVAQPTVTTQNTLPTAAQRTGDFSGAVNTLGVMIPVIDPNTGKQFPGNIIPGSRIDPTGQALLNELLLPNGYVNPAAGQQHTANFIASATPYYHKTDSIFRGDWMITDHMNMYFRYGQDTKNSINEFEVSPGVGSVVQFLPGHQYAGHITNTITPTMVNEVVVGVGHNNFGYYRAGGQTDSDWFRTSTFDPPTLRPFPTGPQYEPYLPAATFAGGALPNPGAFIPGYTGNQATNSGFPIPYSNFNDTYTINEDLSKVLGSHSLKTGVYWEDNSKIEPAAGNLYAGQFNFGSNVNNPLDTGDGYANALLGNFQTYTESSNREVPNPHFIEVEGYIQDNWRVSRRFNLEYGVRWYHMGVMVDKAGDYSEFYPQLWNPNQAAAIYRPGIVGGKSVAVNPLTGATTFAALQNTLVPGSGSAVNGMHIDGLTGKSDFYSFPFLVFSPRLGFAWDVFGNGKTAIRGSFGTFYNRPNANFISGEGNAPAIYTPIVYYSQINQIPQAASSAALSPVNAASIYGNQKVERTHMLNFTVQRDIGFSTVVDVAYVGTFDRDAQNTTPLNPIPEFAYANPANILNNAEINANLLRTKYPGMGAITYYSDSLSAVNYNGLQVQAEHRLSHRLQFGAAYTFSKSLGTTANLDPYNSARGFYYGPLTQDRSHVVSINWLYRLPNLTASSNGMANRLARAVVDDWTLSGADAFQTGAPVTPTCTSISPGPANSDPSLSVIAARCQEIAPNSFQQSFYTNFNTSAFTLAPPGTFGNTGLGILREPSWYNLDMSLDKHIQLGSNERRVLRLRIEAYNILNHTEFSTIGTTLTLQGSVNTNTTWGQDTAVLPSRVLSTTIRLEF